MFTSIRNTVTCRPSTFSAKNHWSITFRWWQVYRTTGFRCYVFPLLICRTCLAEMTHAQTLSTYIYTHTHTHTHEYKQRYTYIMKMHLHIKRQSEHWTLVLWWRGIGGENNWFLIRPPRGGKLHATHHQNDGQNYKTKLRYISSEHRTGSRYYETALQDS
jgi:hypothetical protein